MIHSAMRAFQNKLKELVPTLPHQRKELTEPDLSEPETLKAGNCYPTITSTRTPAAKLSSRTSSPTSQRREAWWWDRQETEPGSSKVCVLYARAKSSFPAFEGNWKWDCHVWSSIGRYFSSNWLNWFIHCTNIGKILLNYLVIKIIKLLELNSPVNDFSGCLLIIPTDAGSRYNTASRCCRYCFIITKYDRFQCSQMQFYQSHCQICAWI